MNSSETPGLVGGIEAGGSKFVCGVALDPGEPLETHRMATRAPQETMSDVAEFFRDAARRLGRLQALGIGTFGPAGVRADSSSYGKILQTPKPGWTGFDFIGAVRESFSPKPPPIAFETDVNAAAVGEARYGAARGFEHVAYVTVGTGIGGGFLVSGKPLHGRMHPEIGHMLVGERPGKAVSGRLPRSVCRFHRDCLEGRASGPAIEQTWAREGKDLPADHAAWAVEADHLAAGLVNLTATWSPEIIVLGGGVSQKEGLLEEVRQRFGQLAGGYWDLPPLDQYIVAPALGQNAGIVGALALASDRLPPGVTA